MEISHFYCWLVAYEKVGRDASRQPVTVFSIFSEGGPGG